MYYTDMDGQSYPAQKHIRQLKGEDVITWSRNVVSSNILEVEAGTNGYHGGDSSKGARTYLRLADVGNSAMWCRAQEYDGVEIVLGGDTELATVIEALKWMVSVLEAQSEVGR